MVETGYVSCRVPVRADRVLPWNGDLVYEILDPQPVTYTEHTSARAIRAMLDGPRLIIMFRRMSMPSTSCSSHRFTSAPTPYAPAGGPPSSAVDLDNLDGFRRPKKNTPLGQQHGRPGCRARRPCRTYGLGATITTRIPLYSNPLRQRDVTFLGDPQKSRN